MVMGHPLAADIFPDSLLCCHGCDAAHSRGHPLMKSIITGRSVISHMHRIVPALLLVCLASAVPHVAADEPSVIVSDCEVVPAVMCPATGR